MALSLKAELRELSDEFKAGMQEAINGAEKEASLKRCLKTFTRLEKIFASSPEGATAVVLLEKVKDEINNSLKLLKKKEPGEHLLNRSFMNAQRYYDIATKDFLGNLAKMHAHIDHTKIVEEEEFDQNQDK